MFENRRLVIATMHEKEKAIAPVLESSLGVICFVNNHFNTDSLGTFTGEVERTLDPLSAAREKCLRSMEANNCDLGVASEGSFGPHPAMPFVSADDEFLIFIDQKNKLEIVVRELSTETNFSAQKITSAEELMQFAKGSGFPSHSLILRRSKDDHSPIFKGIREENALLEAFNALISSYGSAYVETDMRAMHNPSRMQVIAKAALRLAERIKSSCPSCGIPGFGITGSRSGLPCGLCGYPTHSVLAYVSECQQCGYSSEEMYPHGKKEEDPMYCDLCNP